MQVGRQIFSLGFLLAHEMQELLLLNVEIVVHHISVKHVLEPQQLRDCLSVRLTCVIMMLQAVHELLALHRKGIGLVVLFKEDFKDCSLEFMALKVLVLCYIVD